MSVTEITALVGAAGTLLGGGGWFVARATVRAARVTREAQEAVARLQTQPQVQQTNLAVLEATVKRVDQENEALRGRMGRLEALVRAFSWSADRWCRQMRSAGIEPEAPHPLVEEYNRTGV